MKNIITTLTNTNTNNVFSPISLYYALALLSQVTKGDTKKELLSVLKLKEDEVLDKMNDLYKALNINRDNGRLMLNSSLWFNNRYNFFENKANEIANNTNSAIRTGKMGTTEFDNQIHRWINVNTHSLLKDSVENIKTTTDGLLSLISTISEGSGDVCLVEMKMASNSKLEQNLANQLDVYKDANHTDHGVTIIIYTDDKEKGKLDRILTKLELKEGPDLVLVDARRKVSASNVKTSSK